VMRMLLSFGVAIAIASVAPRSAEAQVVEKTYRLSYVANGSLEHSTAIVKIKLDDGKATAELVAASPRFKEPSLKSVARDGNVLRVVINSGVFDMVFESPVPAADAKRINGSMATDGVMFPALLTVTEDKEIDAKSVARPVDCPPAAQALELSNKVTSLRIKILQTKDAEKRKELIKEFTEADAKAKKETPALYREIVAKHADSPAVFNAALNLMKGADARPDDLKSWATTVANAAKSYGPRWQAEVAAQVAESLLKHNALAGDAIEYARLAENGITPTTSATEQARILGLMSRALKVNKQNDKAMAYEVRLEKLETLIDKEYSAKMPPFKGTEFKGREGKSERAVFMELFTGATCPPCVAADLAFDVLAKTYKANELVLIQYHVHIPGPDPMTNPDTLARWKYYTEAYPGKIRGVPSSLFNGAPAAGGGGGVANAEGKYNAYRAVIEPLLEEEAGAKLSASAVRKGDRIDINVEVAGLAKAGTDKKLRILLAEETVRYPGSNKIRLHHNVVRAFPGGVEGVGLVRASSKHQASIDVSELRGDLNKYLDGSGKIFANPARPMELANLKVIAFIQDDETHAIVQAVQTNVVAK
jgi:hypothetical protein